MRGRSYNDGRAEGEGESCNCSSYSSGVEKGSYLSSHPNNVSRLGVGHQEEVDHIAGNAGCAGHCGCILEEIDHILVAVVEVLQLAEASL